MELVTKQLWVWGVKWKDQQGETQYGNATHATAGEIFALFPTWYPGCKLIGVWKLGTPQEVEETIARLKSEGKL